MQLTIFRMKTGIDDHDAIIPTRQGLEYSEVRVDDELIGILYVDRSRRDQPSWIRFFGSNLGQPPGDLSTASVGAAFVTSVDGRTFVITFGYGRYLIDEDAVESRFGLRATLNAVDPAQLRSIDHKRLEAVSRHTREELSRAAGLDQFGLDTQRDLLRAVTGTPSDATLGDRLSGSDALVAIANISINNVRHHLREYSKVADQKTYKKHFPWVDNIAQVTDSLLLQELDQKLVTKLHASTDDIWLAPPEIVDWANVAQFQYRSGKTANQFSDLDWRDYFAESGIAADLDIGRLQHDRVYLVKADDETTKRSWQLRRCIIAEVDHKAARYVLSEGDWYRVDKDFLVELDAFIAALPRSTIAFPQYAHADEGAYNKYAAKKLKHMKLMDQDFINFAQRGKVEACDLYSKDRVFIHVKRYGASGTLSHLFAQGSVSAQLMVAEPSFRSAFHSKVGPSFSWGDPAASIAAQEFEICYAVIPKPGKTLELPFFSKVNLRTAVRVLAGLGFRYSIAEIPS